MHSQAVILFDGVCNLCNASVRFIIRRDRRKRFRFAPLQAEAAGKLASGVGCQAPGMDSMILIEGGRVFARSAAALRIARGLGGLWPVLYALMLVPRPIRDGIYDWVARNRYRWFGQRPACMVPDAETADRFVS